MRLLIIATISIAATALLSFMILVSCESGTSSVESKDITGLGIVKIKSIGSKGSPYGIEEYSRWDYWVYNHIITEPTAFADGKVPENWTTLTARVTESGYLVPMSEKVRLHHEGLKTGDYDYWKTCPYSVQAEGVLDTGLNEQRLRDQRRIRGEYYPSVPDWLVEDPPFFCMLMPNGDVVTRGPLGSGEKSTSEDNSTGCCGPEQYYRYNDVGELLRTVSGVWWILYFNDHDYEWPDGEYGKRKDGYIIFRDEETSEVLSVWDWDGTPIEGTAVPPFRDAHNFMALRPESLLGVYEGQQLSEG